MSLYEADRDTIFDPAAKDEAGKVYTDFTGAEWIPVGGDPVLVTITRAATGIRFDSVGPADIANDKLTLCGVISRGKFYGDAVNGRLDLRVTYDLYIQPSDIGANSAHWLLVLLLLTDEFADQFYGVSGGGNGAFNRFVSRLGFFPSNWAWTTDVDLDSDAGVPTDSFTLQLSLDHGANCSGIAAATCLKATATADRDNAAPVTATHTRNDIVLGAMGAKLFLGLYIKRQSALGRGRLTRLELLNGQYQKLA